MSCFASNRTTPRGLFRASRRSVRRRGDGEDDGFILLESLVALTIISIVMAALAAFFVATTQSTNRNRLAQVAAQLADSSIDTVNGLGAGPALSRRDQQSVSHEWARPVASMPAVAKWLTGVSQACDPNATPGEGEDPNSATALKTIANNQVVNGVNYAVWYFVGWNGSTPACSSAPTSGNPYLRVVVAVVWNANVCPAAGCVTVAGTLLSGSGDPLFTTPTNPPLPVMGTIPAQVNDVGDNVNGLVGMPGCSSACPATASNGVPPFVFSATGLPPGLSMNSIGVVTGTPTTTSGSPFAVTVTVQDGFFDTASTTFNWTIYNAISVSPSPVPNQATVLNASTTLKVTATGGSGTANLVWTDPTHSLPTGLTISSSGGVGTISGKPTTSGTWTVSLTVTDSTTKSIVTVTFTWLVGAVIITPPGPQIGTVTVASSLTLQASGGSGSAAWTVIGGALPPGLGLGATTGVVSGTPTMPGTYSAAVQVTYPNNLSAQTTVTWTIYALPTISAPPTFTGDVGVALNTPLIFTCPSGSCTFAISGQPAGVTVSSSGALTGTPTTAGSSTNVKISITQSSGGTVTTSAFTMTIYNKPTITTPANQRTNLGATVSVPVTATCANTPCTYTMSGNPTWLSINSSTGVMNVVGPTAAVQATGLTVTVTDAAGASATTATFTWLVDNQPTIVTPANQVITVGAVANVPLSYTCSGTCTVTLSGNPSWIHLNAGSTALTGTAPTGGNDSGMTVTVSDGFLSATSNSFSWTVDAAPTIAVVNTQWSPLNTAINIPVTTSCHNTPCTYTVTGGAAWMSFASTGITGTTPAASVTYPAVVLKVTDASGISVTTQFLWVVGQTRIQSQANTARCLDATNPTTVIVATCATTSAFNWTLQANGTIVSAAFPTSCLTATSSGGRNPTYTATLGSCTPNANNVWSWPGDGSIREPNLGLTLNAGTNNQAPTVTSIVGTPSTSQKWNIGV